MHLILSPIDVAQRNATPTAFCWKGYLYEVESVLETWTARGQWWGREDQREYFMLMTTNGVMEIYLGREGWMLSRVYD